MCGTVRRHVCICIADFRRREILIARDHFGIKPLLYRIEDQSFAFASEFQALKQLPDWTGEIDLYSIDCTCATSTFRLHKTARKDLQASRWPSNGGRHG